MITQQHNYVYNQHCNSVTMTFIHLLLLCCTNRMLSACSVAGVRQSRWQTVPHGRSVGCEVADCSTRQVRGMWGGRLFHMAGPWDVRWQTVPHGRSAQCETLRSDWRLTLTNCLHPVDSNDSHACLRTFTLGHRDPVDTCTQDQCCRLFPQELSDVDVLEASEDWVIVASSSSQ